MVESQKERHTIYLDSVVGGESTREAVTQGHGVDCKVVAEVDVCQIHAHFTRFVTAIVVVAVTELAFDTDTHASWLPS